VSDYLKQSGDRFQKAIVFCVDTEHAARMRRAFINENQDLVQQNALTRTEMLQALDAVLAMNNIAMIPIGEKFIKVVPLAEAGASGLSIKDINNSILPEFGPFQIQIVQLKYTKPSQMVQVLQQFTKTPAAVLPIEDSGMLVLRDSAENVRRMMEMIERLDQTVPSVVESAVIPIKYALAEDIATALNSLSGGGGGSTSFGSRGTSGSTGSLGTSRSVGQGNARGIGGAGGYGGGIGQQGGIGGAGGIGGGTLGGGAGLGGAGGSASPSFTQRVQSLIANAGGGGGKGEVNATIYIVDSSTGQVLASKSVVGVSNKKALSLGYSGAGFSGDVAGFKNDNVGKAVESACGEAVKFMIEQLPKIPWSGTVVQVASGKVYINRGTREGVTSGQQFIIGNAEIIRDPDSGEVLDTNVTEIARMLGGEKVAASAVAHARELLESARGKTAKSRV